MLGSRAYQKIWMGRLRREEKRVEDERGGRGGSGGRELRCV